METMHGELPTCHVTFALPMSCFLSCEQTCLAGAGTTWKPFPLPDIAIGSMYLYSITVYCMCIVVCLGLPLPSHTFILPISPSNHPSIQFMCRQMPSFPFLYHWADDFIVRRHLFLFLYCCVYPSPSWLVVGAVNTCHLCPMEPSPFVQTLHTFTGQWEFCWGLGCLAFPLPSYAHFGAEHSGPDTTPLPCW